MDGKGSCSAGVQNNIRADRTSAWLHGCTAPRVIDTLGGSGIGRFISCIRLAPQVNGVISRWATVNSAPRLEQALELDSLEEAYLYA